MRYILSLVVRLDRWWAARSQRRAPGLLRMEREHWDWADQEGEVRDV